MADKRITEVDFIDSLQSDESFFVNQNNTIKQINKGDITFEIVNGGTGANNVSDARTNLGLGAVAVEDVVHIAKGGTGATDATMALINLGAAALEHEHSVDNISDFSEYVYDATSSRDANTILAAPDGTGGVANFRKLVAADLPTVTVAKGGTGSSNGATGLKNLFAAGATVLTEGTSYQYGASLPAAGTKGRIFFKKVTS